MKFSPTLSTGSSLFESDYIKEITPLTLNKQGSKVPEQSQSNENLKVVIRVRPPMAREIKDGKFTSTVALLLYQCRFKSHQRTTEFAYSSIIRSNWFRMNNCNRTFRIQLTTHFINFRSISFMTRRAHSRRFTTPQQNFQWIQHCRLENIISPY